MQKREVQHTLSALVCAVFLLISCQIEVTCSQKQTTGVYTKIFFMIDEPISSIYPPERCQAAFRIRTHTEREAPTSNAVKPVLLLRRLSSLPPEPCSGLFR